jgi:Lipase (class 2)
VVANDLKKAKWTGQDLKISPNWQTVTGTSNEPVGPADFYTLSFTAASNNNICQQAVQLARFLAEVRTQSGARQVDVVAHSIGGLVARAYMQFGSNLGKFEETWTALNPRSLQGLACATDPPPQYQDDIATLITYGTPHDGINSILNVLPLEFERQNTDFQRTVNDLANFPLPNGLRITNLIGKDWTIW